MPKAKRPEPVLGLKAPRTSFTKAKRVTTKIATNKETSMEETKTASINRNCPVEMMSVDAPFFDEDFEKEASIEKDAATIVLGQNNAASAFKTGLYSALGTALAGGLVTAGFAAYDKYKNRQNMSKAYQTLQQAIQLTPALRRYDMATLESYLPMIVKASPTVANDPRLLANYLESMLDAEGHLNLGTFRELSGLENTVLNNQSLMQPYRTEFIKGVGKETGSGLAKGFSGGFKDIAANMSHGNPAPGQGNVTPAQV